MGMVAAICPPWQSWKTRKAPFHRMYMAADGTLLGEGIMCRTGRIVNISEISPNIINTLVATEDDRFYSHAGIDPIATALAATALCGYP